MIAYTGNVYSWNSHEEAHELYSAETGIISKCAKELSYRLEDTNPVDSELLMAISEAAESEAEGLEFWEDLIVFDEDASDQELIEALVERHSDMRMRLVNGDREFLCRIRQELTV